MPEYGTKLALNGAPPAPVFFQGLRFAEVAKCDHANWLLIVTELECFFDFCSIKTSHHVAVDIAVGCL